MILAAAHTFSGHLWYWSLTLLLIGLALAILAVVGWILMDIYRKQQENKRARRAEQIRLAEILQRMRATKQRDQRDAGHDKK